MSGSYNSPMDKQDSLTPGIEVREHPLNQREAGYLSGVYKAWTTNTLTEADFRGAMELLMAREQELEHQPVSDRDAVRVVTRLSSTCNGTIM